MKNFQELMCTDNFDFNEMDANLFLLGLLSAFDNRYQAKADNSFKEIGWKQFFVIICIDLFKESPTLKELSETVGSSHQNVKQILNKLEKKGFVDTIPDQHDRRKQRIVLTEKTRKFCAEHDEASQKIIAKIFEGIDPKDIQVVIKTIMQMEKNLMEV